jgi:hypothetical protein
MTVDGRRRRVRLGTDRGGWTNGRAMVALEEQLDASRAGRWTAADARAAVPDDPTFRAFASSRLEDNMLEWHQSTITDIRWRLESHLLPHVGDVRLSAFDIPRVTMVKTTLLKESRRVAERLDAGVIERDGHNMPLRPLSNASINKVMALLGRILDDAVERGYLRDNPARRVRRLRHRAPRRPILEPHEVRAMLEAAAARLSISLSTAHHRYTRFEQAGDPVPSFAPGSGSCALPACASTRRAAHAAASTSSQSICACTTPRRMRAYGPSN